MATPLPICYLNGAYLPLAEARVSPLDRAFLFADAVYEVMPVYGRRPFRFAAHCERLARSLKALGMADPYTREQWHELIATLIERNAPHNTAADLYVYWQVTRGMQFGRNHAPLPDIERTVFAFCAPLILPDQAALERGVSCVTAQDNRWGRCDIKSTALLANILLRERATEAGASEAILLREGLLTEGSASAVHVVVNGELLTPALSPQVLPGLTRGAVEKMAARAQIPCRDAALTQAQLRAASEVMLSAATREVIAVTAIDGIPVGTGQPGPVWRAVHTQLQKYKGELAGRPW
ncbi:MAG TPA: D-amino acid aminotransferase [Steroidobacteraceae bacterium]|jgi:D-alanine transaminase|nr:D-amino acid aminotransferase [Steroidobacteraceae bacterium]